MAKDTRPYPLKARERIQVGKILTKLGKHVDGEVEMTPTQINAARILLNKCIPDMKSVEQTNTGEMEHKHSIDNQSVEQAIENVRGWLNSVRA